MATPQNGNSGHLTALAERSAALASTTYSSFKERLPESVKPQVEKVEASLSQTAAPYVHRAQDAGARPRSSVGEGCRARAAAPP